MILLLQACRSETTPADIVCPELCDCAEAFTTIICNLTKSRQLILPSRVHKLYLRKDYIGPILNNTINRLTNLEELDLSYSKVISLQNGVFRYMEQLKRLNLRGNLLTNINDDIFQDCRKLEYLDLSHNLFRFIPDASVRFLSNLHLFNISYNNLVFAKLGVRFQVTRRLKIMDFSGNNFGFISGDDLDIMTGWESRVAKNLNFSNCNLRVLDPEAIINVKNLESLDLSHNVNLELTNLTMFISAAQEVSLRQLDLSYTNMAYKINGTDFTSENLGPLAIEELYLDGNGFNEIDEAALSYLTLKRLSLCHNNISSLSGTFAPHNNLQFLDISHNRVSTISESFKNILINMESLLLSHNQLGSESGLDISTAVKLKDVDLSYNQFESFTIPRELRKLKAINLASNKIQTLNSNEPLYGLESLVKLDLSKNKLTTLVAFMFRDSPNIELVKFDRNKIDAINHQAFVPNCPKYLDISYNNVTTVRHFGWHDVKLVDLSHNMISIVEIQAFHALDSLQELYLNDNNISSVDKDVFSHVGNLTELNLRGNHLSDPALLHEIVRPLSKLKIIDISYNKFSDMNVSTMPFINSYELVSIRMGNNQLTFLSPYLFSSLRKLESVDFSHNPLHCDCELLPLQSWAHKTSINIKGKDNYGYRCFLPGYRNGKSLFNFSVRTFECNQYMFYVVVLSATGGGAIVLAIVIATVCHLWFRYRKKKVSGKETSKADLVGFKAVNGTVPKGKSEDLTKTAMTLRENYLYSSPSDTLIDVEFENPMVDHFEPDVIEKVEVVKPEKKKAEKERSNERKKQKIKKLESDLKKYEKILKEVRFQNRHGANKKDLGYLDLSSAARKERHRKTSKNHKQRTNKHHSDDELIERKRRPRGNKDLVRMLSSRQYRSMPDVVSYVNSLPRREPKGYPYSRVPIVHIDHPDRGQRGWVRSLIDIPRGRSSGIPSGRRHYENLRYALSQRAPGGYHRIDPQGYHTISSGYRKSRMNKPDVEQTFSKTLGRSRSHSTSLHNSVWV